MKSMNYTDPEIDATAVLEPPVAAMPAVQPIPARFRKLVGQWWISFAASSVFVVCGHSLIKAGLNAASMNATQYTGLARMLHSVLNAEVVCGLAIYLLGSLCWMVAVAQQEISFLYPLSSVNYVLVVIISVALFREAISPLRGVGVAFIVLGMVLMNRRSRGGKQ
jgi:multidrug transporter EmrE-like cation transporter